MAEDRPYEKLMLHHGMPGCLVVQLLPVEGRWTFVVLLCVASQAAGDGRGTLIVKDETPVDPEWVAKYAGVDVETVEATLATLAEHGTLAMEDRHGALRFANWDHYNPPRKASDSRESAAERKRRQRAREKEERDARKAADKLAEEEGRAAQMVMDDDSSAGVRAVEDTIDPLSIQCPKCLVSPGQQCVTRNGAVTQHPHAKRIAKVAEVEPVPESFFRSGRGGGLLAPAPLLAELPVAEMEGWEPVAAALHDRLGSRYLANVQLAGREHGKLYLRLADPRLTAFVADRYTAEIGEVASDVLGEPVVVEVVDERWRPAERAA